MGFSLMKKTGVRRLLGDASISAGALERLGEHVEEETGRLLEAARSEAQTHGRRRISSGDIDLAWSRLHEREESYEV